ncbi:DUF1275 domain-containing protein [Rothia sp. AR01]|uniref:DUF1275 domain-containing protein n=1 Tax=Rothia santali TaxID=2949643 RepID=A0A9X2KJ98_9MICC|nr:YoaK family protein [Rothia santali]MCP3426880.1 DUF1275 domain-containing protein [Rothia santali]
MLLTRVYRYAHLLSGPRRTPLFDRHLAYLLVLIAGALNAVGFVAVGMYTSHMTGMFADLAANTLAFDVGLIVAGVLAICSFVLGAVSSTVLFTWGSRHRLASRYANVLVIEGFLMLFIGLLAGTADQQHYERLLVIPLCFTMGLQNALITKIRDFPVRTTHVTGMITDLGVELGRLLYFSRKPGACRVRADREKLTVLSTLIGLFLVGGMIGGSAYWLLGFKTLLVGAVLILLAALPPSVRDLVGKVKKRSAAGGEASGRLPVVSSAGAGAGAGAGPGRAGGAGRDDSSSGPATSGPGGDR